MNKKKRNEIIEFKKKKMMIITCTASCFDEKQTGFLLSLVDSPANALVLIDDHFDSVRHSTAFVPLK
jgi:hypothetical protein